MPSNGALMQKAALTKLSVGVIYGRLKERDLTMPHRCDAKRHRRAMEGHNALATVGRADEDERIAEEYSGNYREDASPSSAGYDRGWGSGTSSGARLAPASAVLPNAVRTDVGPGIGCSLFVGQRTFETRSLYLILVEKLFTLPAANEMLPLSAVFAGKRCGTALRRFDHKPSHAIVSIRLKGRWAPTKRRLSRNGWSEE